MVSFRGLLKCLNELHENSPSLTGSITAQGPVLQVPMKYFLHLLDAHNAGQEAGVRRITFRSIFYVCHDCGRYMTKRMASSHHDTEFDDSDPEEYGDGSHWQHTANSTNPSL